MKRRVLFVLLSLMLLLSVSYGTTGCGEDKDTNGEPTNGNGDGPVEPTESDLPDLLIITTTGLGSSAHGWSSVLGDAFKDLTGIPVRLVPHGTDIARYIVMKDGDAHFVCASSINGWAPTFAMLEFESWGPQPVHIVWQGSLLNTGIAVRGDDTSINSIADLAGKKVSNVPGMPSINLGRDSHLAFAGLTTDDVTLVDCPSYPSVMDALKLGTIDAAAVIATSASGAYDIAASAHGIKWVEMPASDTAGWARLSKIAPYVPALCSKGAGIDPANPLELSALTNNTYCHGTETVSEELAYLWAKTIYTLAETYKDRHPSLPGFTIEQALAFQYSPYPYHPGTIEYLKEIGVWTDEHQAWQDSILAAMNARVAGG